MIKGCALALVLTRSQTRLYVDHESSRVCTLFLLSVCVCSQQLLPVVLVGTSQHAVSPVRLMLDILEEVRRAEDAHAARRREARTQPQQHGTHRRTRTPIREPIRPGNCFQGSERFLQAVVPPGFHLGLKAGLDQPYWPADV